MTFSLRREKLNTHFNDNKTKQNQQQLNPANDDLI